jgi:hypothetical protein
LLLTYLLYEKHYSLLWLCVMILALSAIKLRKFSESFG